MRASLVLLLVTVWFSVSAVAAPRFARIFADHMVMQRGMSARVWGAGADAADSLFVRFGDIRVRAKVDGEGNWAVLLPELSASERGRELRLFDGEAQVAAVKDVVVGDVWLAAGQSNMQFPVRGMVKGLPASRDWVASADLSAIRFRRVNDRVLTNRVAEATDLATAEAWKVMTPKSVLNFSAVGAVFAREVHERVRVPVGIIDVSWGGKPIEPFIPRERFSSPLMKRIRELADADRLEELARVHGGVIIRNPEGHPGAIFNARMAPITGFSVRGFLWYQAESNAGRGEDPREYRHKMRAMIDGWRDRWQAPDLPVYYVQLPSFPPTTGWVRMREEQRLATVIPNTYMAVTIDVRGEGIHPPDKLSVGRRLARLALADSYGMREIVAVGPVYRGHAVQGEEVRVQFDHVEGGLMVGDKPDVAPARETPNAELRWFELAGADRVWHPAVVQIDGAEFVVTADAVKKPVAVRYACHTQPQGGNLYNRAGMPASPFCSHPDWLPWLDQR